MSKKEKNIHIDYLTNVNVLRETFENDVIKSNDENPIVNPREDSTCTKKGNASIFNCENFLIQKTLNVDLTKKCVYLSWENGRGCICLLGQE